jgi:hypothetical protein
MSLTIGLEAPGAPVAITSAARNADQSLGIPHLTTTFQPILILLYSTDTFERANYPNMI